MQCGAGSVRQLAYVSTVSNGNLIGKCDVYADKLLLFDYSEAFRMRAYLKFMRCENMDGSRAGID